MRKIFFVVLSITFLLLRDNLAFSCCQSANCPIDTSSTSYEIPSKGKLTLDISYENIDQDQPQIGRHNARIGEIRRRTHDEIRTRNQAWKLNLDYAITDRLSLGVFLPLLSREHDHKDNEIHGERREEEDEGHGEEEHEMGGDLPKFKGWNFTNIGDLTILGKYALLLPSSPEGSFVSVGLGIKFPTGKTDEDNAGGEEAEPTLQPGTESYDLIFGTYYSKKIKVPTLFKQYTLIPFFINGTYKINGTGIHNYQIGDEVRINLGTSYPLFRRWDLLTQFNFNYKAHDHKGNTYEETTDTGGRWLYFSPGLRFKINNALSLYGYIQIPLWQYVNRIQLTADYNLLFGFSYNIN